MMCDSHVGFPSFGSIDLLPVLQAPDLHVAALAPNGDVLPGVVNSLSERKRPKGIQRSSKGEPILESLRT